MLQKILYYLNPLTLFRSKEKNINVRLMHGMNRISILMFLVALVMIVLKFISK